MNSGKNYDIWDSVVHTKSSFAKLSSYKKLEYLCKLAHMATNSHNTQPWFFLIDEENNKISLYLNGKRILQASDKEGRQATVSMGCAIENMVLGAKDLGLKGEVTIENNDKKSVKPDMAERIYIGYVTFFQEDNKNVEEKMVKAIFSRRVTRTEYKLEEKINTELIKKLEEITNSAYTTLHSVTDPVRRRSIAEFQGQADNFVINSKKFSRELGDWLLPNDTSSFVGMPGVGFGLDDKQASRMHQALSGEKKLEPEDGLRFSTGGKRGFEKSPYIGFLTSPKDDIRHWIEAGRCFQRIFLHLVSEGYAVTVHAGVVEVTLINKMFAITLGTTQEILMLFRAGKVKKEKDGNRPHSPRLPIEEVIINTSKD